MFRSFYVKGATVEFSSITQSLTICFRSAGPTLEVGGEVESQVVVDFETAFSTEDQRYWKPRLESMMGSQEDDDGEDDDDDDDDGMYCNAACCLGQNVHDDQYVDESQKMEYINHLFPDTPGSDTQPSVAIIPRSLDEVQNDFNPQTSPLIPDGDLLIMSYLVFGFVLQNRKWGMLLYFQVGITLTDIIPSSSTRPHIHDGSGCI